MSVNKLNKMLLFKNARRGDEGRLLTLVVSAGVATA